MEQTVNAGNSAPTSAAAAANEFLSLGERDRIAITQMKLQKLLFYGHAWHLALKNRPLFEEDFEAWPWGPVVRDIYTQTRQYGRGPVLERITHLERIEGGPLNWRISMPPPISNQDTLELIRAVWDSHKAYTAIQLSNSTHAPGEPWTIVRDQYGNLDGKPTIPNDLIESVFKSKLERVVVENTGA